MAEQKKPGPRRQYGEREDVHLKLPKEIVTFIDSVTINRTQWLIDAAREKMERDNRRV